jgi:DNA-binding Xre family transcriptional regulator
MVIVKSNLKVLMAQKDITQDELAKATNLNRVFINKLANGKIKEVNIQHLAKLSQFFDNCPIQDLLYFEKIA